MSRQLGLIITKGKDFVFSRENLHGACLSLSNGFKVTSKPIISSGPPSHRIHFVQLMAGKVFEKGLFASVLSRYFVNAEITRFSPNDDRSVNSGGNGLI